MPFIKLSEYALQKKISTKYTGKSSSLNAPQNINNLVQACYGTGSNIEFFKLPF